MVDANRFQSCLNVRSIIRRQSVLYMPGLGVPMTMGLSRYNCCTSLFSRATFTVQLRRKSLYYVINLVVPCCLFSVIAIVTFILPPASGERVGIG